MTLTLNTLIHCTLKNPISYLHLPTFKSQAAIVSKNPLFEVFSVSMMMH